MGGIRVEFSCVDGIVGLTKGRWTRTHLTRSPSPTVWHSIPSPHSISLQSVGGGTITHLAWPEFASTSQTRPSLHSSWLQSSALPREGFSGTQRGTIWLSFTLERITQVMPWSHVISSHVLGLYTTHLAMVLFRLVVSMHRKFGSEHST